jgi:hypothetical protein
MHSPPHTESGRTQGSTNLSTRSNNLCDRFLDAATEQAPFSYQNQVSIALTVLAARGYMRHKKQGYRSCEIGS